MRSGEVMVNIIAHHRVFPMLIAVAMKFALISRALRIFDFVSPFQAAPIPLDLPAPLMNNATAEYVFLDTVRACVAESSTVVAMNHVVQ